MFGKSFTTEKLNEISKNSVVEHIGIKITEIGDDYLRGTMPVDKRTNQPFGILHGGSSVVLAETLGSLAATMAVNDESKACVGLEINANHIKSASSGQVEGTARPIHVGRSTQIWEIKIVNENNQLVCISRLTIAVIDKKR